MIALRYAKIYIIGKNIAHIDNTTTNHGADRATSCHSGIQHEIEGHTTALKEASDVYGSHVYVI